VKDGEAVDDAGEAVGARELSGVALSLPEAAAALGVRRRPFRDEILTDPHLVRVGHRVLVGNRELAHWVDDGGMLSGLATGDHDAR
jgi:hypothetical protein